MVGEQEFLGESSACMNSKSPTHSNFVFVMFLFIHVNPACTTQQWWKWWYGYTYLSSQIWRSWDRRIVRMRPAWRLLWQDPAFKPAINKEKMRMCSLCSAPRYWPGCCPNFGPYRLAVCPGNRLGKMGRKPFSVLDSGFTTHSSVISSGEKDRGSSQGWSLIRTGSSFKNRACVHPVLDGDYGSLPGQSLG